MFNNDHAAKIHKVNLILQRFRWINDYVKTQPTPSDQLFYLFIWHLYAYSSHTKPKVNELRVKSPTKANTDLHNGDLKDTFFSFSDSTC